MYNKNSIISVSYKDALSKQTMYANHTNTESEAEAIKTKMHNRLHPVKVTNAINVNSMFDKCREKCETVTSNSLQIEEECPSKGSNFFISIVERDILILNYFQQVRLLFVLRTLLKFMTSITI